MTATAGAIGRTLAVAALVLAAAAAADAQSPLSLQIANGRVTLHARNVPVRTILAEWARVGGTQIVNGERVAGAPLTLDLEGAGERQALDIILRGVAGFILAAQDPGARGASAFGRILIIPTSVAPRNPPPASPPPSIAAGGIRPAPSPIQDRLDDGNDDASADTGSGDAPPPPADARALPIGGMPAAPYVAAPPAPSAQPVKGDGAAAASNPFGIPAGSSSRPGEVAPVAPARPATPAAPNPNMVNPLVANGGPTQVPLGPPPQN